MGIMDFNGGQHRPSVSSAFSHTTQIYKQSCVDAFVIVSVTSPVIAIRFLEWNPHPYGLMEAFRNRHSVQAYTLINAY